MNNTNAESFSNVDTKFDLICIIVLIINMVGVLGNLLTLCAILYAKHKKKHNFHKTWNSNSVFIWHVAFIDFLSSINMMLIYIEFVFNPPAINDKIVCVISMRSAVTNQEH